MLNVIQANSGELHLESATEICILKKSELYSIKCAISYS